METTDLGNRDRFSVFSKENSQYLLMRHWWWWKIQFEICCFWNCFIGNLVKKRLVWLFTFTKFLALFWIEQGPCCLRPRSPGWEIFSIEMLVQMIWSFWLKNNIVIFYHLSSETQKYFQFVISYINWCV